MAEEEWHLEPYDPELDEAPEGDPVHDCDGEPVQEGDV